MLRCCGDKSQRLRLSLVPGEGAAAEHMVHIAGYPQLLHLIAGFPKRAGSVREVDRAAAFAERCQLGFNQFKDVHRRYH